MLLDLSLYGLVLSLESVLFLLLPTHLILNALYGDSLLPYPS